MKFGKSLAAACALSTIVYTAQGHINGQNAATQKSGNFGCDCHTPARNGQTSVVITSAQSSFLPGQTCDMTVSVTNPTEVSAGVDIAAYKGILAVGPGLRKTGGELVHSTPKILSGGTTAWTFKYTVPLIGTTDTLYATGNAVNGNGNADGGDAWNFSNKFVVNIGQSGVTQIGAPQELKIGIAPNPSNDVATVYLQSEQTIHGQLEVVDRTGKIVRHLNLVQVDAGSNPQEIQLRGLPSGAYLVRVRTSSGELHTGSLIVRH